MTNKVLIIIFLIVLSLTSTNALVQYIPPVVYTVGVACSQNMANCVRTATNLVNKVDTYNHYLNDKREEREREERRRIERDTLDWKWREYDSRRPFGNTRH